ncbi:hypothetical protein QWY86_05115 [Pedobacter aquatilis]|uniref:hypothetical protein n=1 Tax=Pedobacter aquatilis TaxID=351343 RepID=UPI0025B4C1B1|nr:hypothetical protein [Pedobacter aquatilis]MDN3586035.1 hypothetical protein [Pedobacter aquatilis]
MKRILVFIFAISMLVACSKEKITGQSGPEIRLSNSSQQTFKNIIVNTGTGEVNFGDLDAEKKTAYKKFTKAYSYAFVKLEIDGKTYTIQPIDYVGETPLKDGRYTYQISVNVNQGQYSNLGLKLIEE